MQKIQLGARGPMVSRFGLGTMSLLTSQNQTEASALVHQALDAGINLVDTADVYGNGAVEKALNQALRGRRSDVVLATKVGLPMNGDSQRAGGSRRWIIEAVEDSLRRLGTDYIDLYQLHRPDPKTPIEETVSAFDSLIRAGKIRFAGSSVFPAEMMVQFQWEAERQGAEAFVSEQAPYSIFARGIENASLPVCRQYGMGALVWSPLNGGWLTGKYRHGAPVPEGSRAASGNPFVRADDTRKLDLVDALADVAERAGLGLAHMSLAWTLEHPAVSTVLLGPRTPAQLADLLGADGLVLPEDVLNAIDETVAPGTNVDPRNAGWVPVGLAPEQRRSRSVTAGS